MIQLQHRSAVTHSRGGLVISSPRTSFSTARLFAVGVVGVAGVVGVLSIGVAGNVYAQEHLDHVSTTAGSAIFNHDVETMTTTIEAADQTILNYNRFDIPLGATVNFVQPDTNATVLNRVIANNPTEILGQLNADGIVYLVNPSGVMFGQSAVIQVGGLFAAAGNIADSDFLNGELRFTNSANLVNDGQLTALGETGIHLTGQAIRNTNMIHAPQGVVTLSVGGTVYLQDTNSGVMVEVGTVEDEQVVAESAEVAAVNVSTNLETDAPAINGIENTGDITAGGDLFFTVGDVHSLALPAAIQQSGNLNSGGDVELIAEGSVNVSGQVTANQDVVLESVQSDIESNGLITADRLEAFAASDISLNSQVNTFQQVASEGGDIVINNAGSAEQTTEIDFITSAGGDIEFIQAGGDLFVRFFVHSGLSNNGLANSGGNIRINSDGDLLVTALVSSGPGSGGVLNAENLTLANQPQLGAGDITLGGGGVDLILNTDITQPGSYIFGADRDIIVRSEINVTGNASDIQLTADQDFDGLGGVHVTNTGSLTAGQNITLFGSDLTTTPDVTDAIVIDPQATLTAGGSIALEQNLFGGGYDGGGDGFGGGGYEGGRYNSNPADIKANGSLVSDGGVSIYALNAIDLEGASIDAGTGDLNLTANGVTGTPSVLTGAAEGRGAFQYYAVDPLLVMGIGDVTGADLINAGLSGFDVTFTTAFLNTLNDGFSQLVFGDLSSGAHQIVIQAATFTDPVAFNAPNLPGHLYVFGQLNADAGVTFNGPGQTTTLGADIITQGQTVAFNDSVIVAADVATIDTTGGGAFAGGDVFFGGAVNGTTDFQQGLVVNVGNRPTAVTFDGPVGQQTPLRIVQVSEGEASFNGPVAVQDFNQIGDAPVSLGGNIETTGGNVNFEGQVTVTNDNVVITTDGGTVTFDNPIEGSPTNTNPEVLTINTNGGDTNATTVNDSVVILFLGDTNVVINNNVTAELTALIRGAQSTDTDQLDADDVDQDLLRYALTLLGIDPDDVEAVAAIDPLVATQIARAYRAFEQSRLESFKRDLVTLTRAQATEKAMPASESDTDAPPQLALSLDELVATLTQTDSHTDLLRDLMRINAMLDRLPALGGTPEQRVNARKQLLDQLRPSEIDAASFEALLVAVKQYQIARHNTKLAAYLKQS